MSAFWRGGAIRVGIHAVAYANVNIQPSRSSGAPIAVFAPGTLSTLGPTLRAAIGPIHFAGTETATKVRYESARVGGGPVVLIERRPGGSALNRTHSRPGSGRGRGDDLLGLRAYRTKASWTARSSPANESRTRLRRPTSPPESPPSPPEPRRARGEHHERERVTTREYENMVARPARSCTSKGHPCRPPPFQVPAAGRARVFRLLHGHIGLVFRDAADVKNVVAPAATRAPRRRCERGRSTRSAPCARPRQQAGPPAAPDARRHAPQAHCESSLVG